MPLKLCEHCNKSFKAAHQYNRYCSSVCFNIARLKPRLEGDCEYCNKHYTSIYTTTNWIYNNKQTRRFCSKKCQLAHQRKPKLNRICKTCGKQFKIFPSDVNYGRGNFCSMKCRGHFYTAERHPNWNDGATIKNDQLRKSKPYKEWRTAIFIRDRKTCVLCGKKYSKRQTLSAQIEADHIKPRYLFPELTLVINNGRTLCIDCHIKTPTYFNHKYTRADFEEGGKLHKYVLDAKTSINY